MSASEPGQGAGLSPAVVVAAVGLLTGLQPLSTDLYLPALPQVQVGLNVNAAAAQWTLSLLILAFGFGQLVWGPIADRFGRQPVLRWGLGLYVLASIAAVTAPSRGVPERSPRTEPAAEREEFVKDAPSRPAALAAVPAPVASAAKPALKPDAKPDAKPMVPPAPAATAKPPVPKPVAQAASKLPAKPAEKDKPLVRYVVQFGAFADAASAQEARLKAERQGLKTYAQQVDTPQGKRIRVRLGPFTDKAEADKAAAALRKAGLPGAVLTL